MQGTMRPENWIFAAVGPADEENAIQDHLRRLRRSHPAAALRSFDGGGQRVTVLCASADQAIENARYWLWIISPRPASRAQKLALESVQSLAGLKDICTSSDWHDNAVLAIDKNDGTLHVTTDRLNVVKLFHAEIGGRHLLASGIFLFPTENMTPDTRSVASYVLNGSCLNNHTVFEQIAVLERAAHHQFRDGGHSSETYWAFAPGARAGARRWRPEAAASELWELMVQSVSRITSGKHVLLSLSGGYDSGVLLGILGAELKHPDVTCFSYVYGAPKPGSDAEVAARQAALYGYQHMTISSYSGGLLKMLDMNAAAGDALRCPSYEIEAFPALREHFADVADTVMLFGDECFGKKSYRLKRPSDILGANNLKSPFLLDRLSGSIGAEQTARLRAALDAEYSELQRKLDIFRAADDAKDFLYLDQRLQFSLLPLRTSVAGRWFPVAIPLVSPEILDFMAAVPTSYRIDKQLFKKTARRFLPDLFQIPRATRTQFHPDFDQEIAAARDMLTDAIAVRGWKIDDLLGGSELVRLLGTFQATTRVRRVGMRARLKKWAKGLIVKSRFLEDRQHWVRRMTINEFALSPGSESLMLNLLCLSDLLDRPDAARASSTIDL
jgi:hypothetical protein